MSNPLVKISLRRRHAQTVKIGASSLNLEWHQNNCIGLKITATLQNGMVLPTGGPSSGRVCACSLRSRLVYNQKRYLVPFGRGGAVKLWGLKENSLNEWVTDIFVEQHPTSLWSANYCTTFCKYFTPALRLKITARDPPLWWRRVLVLVLWFLLRKFSVCPEKEGLGVLKCCGCWFSDGWVEKIILNKKWRYVGLCSKVVSAVGFFENHFLKYLFSPWNIYLTNFRLVLVICNVHVVFFSPQKYRVFLFRISFFWIPKDSCNDNSENVGKITPCLFFRRD